MNKTTKNFLKKKPEKQFNQTLIVFKQTSPTVTLTDSNLSPYEQRVEIATLPFNMIP